MYNVPSPLRQEGNLRRLFFSFSIFINLGVEVSEEVRYLFPHQTQQNIGSTEMTIIAIVSIIGLACLIGGVIF